MPTLLIFGIIIETQKLSSILFNIFFDSKAKETDWRVQCQERDSMLPEFSVGKCFCEIPLSDQKFKSVIDCSLAHCTFDLSWKSRKSAQSLSSNVLPTEDGFLDNKFSASASSSYKSDCPLGSGWEDESQTIIAGRSTEDASFGESLELDSSNVMRERRKPFMRSCSFHRSLIHDGSSFDSDEDIKFEKSNYRNKENCLKDD